MVGEWEENSRRMGAVLRLEYKEIEKVCNLQVKNDFFQYLTRPTIYVSITQND
jgi:hypothetical protein